MLSLFGLASAESCKQQTLMSSTHNLWWERRVTCDLELDSIVCQCIFNQTTVESSLMLTLRMMRTRWRKVEEGENTIAQSGKGLAHWGAFHGTVNSGLHGWASVDYMGCMLGRIHGLMNFDNSPRNFGSNCLLTHLNVYYRSRIQMVNPLRLVVIKSPLLSRINSHTPFILCSLLLPPQRTLTVFVL